MNLDVLRDIGLSKNESDVYVALLKLGRATANEISRHTHVHRTNVYDTLNTLSEKGLVSFTVVDGKRLFKAEEPERLLALLKEREDRLLGLIPDLKFFRQPEQGMPEVRVYMGITAFRIILEQMLEHKQPIYVLGAPATALEVIGPFMRAFHRRRIAKKIRMLHLYDESALLRVKQLNKMKYTEARVIPSRFTSFISVNICADEVVFMFFVGAPPKQLPIIRIINREMADSFRKYFELMWEMEPKRG